MEDSQTDMHVELSDLLGDRHTDGPRKDHVNAPNGISSDADCSQSRIDDGLEDELDELRAELEAANREKIKAAEYGLLALEEKHQLEQQLDELDHAHEATRQELESTLEVRQIVGTECEA